MPPRSRPQVACLSHEKPPALEELRHLDAEILAAWLNFANGGIAWDQMIDTDKNGTGDTPFFTVMANAEAVRNNPASTKKQIIDAARAAQTRQQRRGLIKRDGAGRFAFRPRQLTANRRHSPGTPLSSCVPRS